MINYDHHIRRQIAAERIDRIADDYARANARRARQRARRRLPLAGGMELVARAKRWGLRPQPAA
jgi:hypothetical protein